MLLTVSHISTDYVCSNTVFLVCGVKFKCFHFSNLSWRERFNVCIIDMSRVLNNIYLLLLIYLSQFILTGMQL